MILWLLQVHSSHQFALATHVLLTPNLNRSLTIVGMKINKCDHVIEISDVHRNEKYFKNQVNNVPAFQVEIKSWK